MPWAFRLSCPSLCDCFLAFRLALPYHVTRFFDVISAADKTVQIWETSNGKLINTLTGHAQASEADGSRRKVSLCCGEHKGADFEARVISLESHWLVYVEDFES